MRRVAELLLCACLLVAPLSGMATETGLMPNGMLDMSQSAANLSVTRGTPEVTSISLEVPDIVVRDQIVDYYAYKSFEIAGEPTLYDEGSPSVPHVTRFYRIPELGSAELVITAADYEIIENVDVMPVQSDEDYSRGMIRKSDVYQQDGWYPPVIAKMSEPMVMRDFRVVTVSLFPVQVNPVTRQARVYSNIQVDVVANNEPGVNEITVPHRPSGTFANIYRGMISNLDENALDDATTAPGTYMIIATTNAGMAPWVDSLYVWKTRKGHKVIVDKRSNWSAGTMASTIRTTYANSLTGDEPPLEFVCLMGDPGASGFGVPTDGSSYDHTFGKATTTDEIEDIAVGRLSGNSSSEMATIHAKLMGYERNPYMADTTWFRKAFLYASIARGIASNYTLMQWGRQMFSTYTGVNNCTILTHTGDDVNPSTVQTQINAGQAFFIWRGSWVGGMSASLAGSTNPGWRLPIVWVVTCATGSFESSGSCVSESWLTAGTSTNPKGGVCGIGTATTGTHNPQNVSLTGGLMYNFANLHVDYLGVALTGAKYWLFPTFLDEGGYAATFSRYCNLMGEPGMFMWTDVPTIMSCTHPTSLNVGTRQVTVHVERADNGIPIADAQVVLWKRGADSTYSVGQTDGQGDITLPVDINATGELLLTITKRNHKPYLLGIPVVQSDVMPMLSTYTLDDDNSGGTYGNNDGIMNPAETIDLAVYIKNFGNMGSATGITAMLTSLNPRVTVTQGSATYANIAAGDSALGSAPFRIVVSPTLQYRETVLLRMQITSAEGSASGVIDLQCSAGAIDYVSHTVTGGSFDPGTSRSLQVTIRNRGNQPLNSANGRLVSLSPFVQVDAATAGYGTIAAGGSAANTTPFTVSSNSLTFRGHQAPMLLITTTASNEIDTTQFTLKVGTALPSDPTGPDGYGYYAYDNTDVNYEMAPTFSYVDISTGLGTNLNLNDTGEQTTINQPWSTARPLPFRFKFYGEVYDSITICSNGWMAFGNQAWNTIFRNYPLPGPQTPEAMIAPYWDDLKTSGSGLGVWMYNDAANGRFIVQWKATGAFNSTQLNFQVILYDTTAMPTLDGNGRILMQYQTVSINFPGDGYEGSGCTMGIAAPGSRVGLQYLHKTLYSSGAATMISGRAVMYTTSAREMFGTITGTVLDSATTLPIEGATITLTGYGYHATTNDQGVYTIPNVLIGTYTAHAEKYRYNPANVTGIVVALDSTSNAYFSLPHPEMELSRDSVIAVTDTAAIAQTFDIINNGNGPLDYAISIYYAGDEDPSPWDSIDAIRVTQQTGDYQVMGCEFVGDYWWVTGGGADGQNRLYKFDLDGQLVGSIPQPSTSAVGWFDMAWDGNLLYGSDTHDITGIDTSGNVVKIIPSPMNPTRALAYDPAAAHFWVTDYTQDIFEIDTLGNIISRIPNSGSNQLAITGLAWNPTDPDGYKLYAFSQNGNSSLLRITRIHPNSQLKETVIDLPGVTGDRAGGCTITPGWNSTLLVFGGIVQNSAGDRMGIYEMDFNTTWIRVTPPESYVPGESLNRITVHFNPEMLRPARYRVDLHIESEVYDTIMVMPVLLTVNPLPNAVTVEANRLPTEYALHQNYPNPFNPSTTIRYDLKDAGFTKLTVYNLLGEKVADLVNEQQPAGRYTISFDGGNLPSGMYFYRLQSGSFNHTTKMVLMK